MPIATTTEENLTPEQSARMKRSRGEDVVPAPGHVSTHVPADVRSINGWGADLDPANRPSYPKEFPSTVRTVRGEVRDWQTPHTKVHVSNEQPNLTPVFGASVPSRGLSGLLRDYAYEYGEGTNRHWMTLVLADRVDMLERMVTDLFAGRPDHYVREKGWGVYLKDNPKRARMLATAGAVSVGLLLLSGVLLRRR
jgi:hypothetical protein